MNQELTQIFDLLRDQQDEMAEQWLQAVKLDQKVPSSDSVSDLTLMDSVPEVLEQILSLASGQTDEFSREKTGFAEVHGRHRAREDFDPRELVREYQVLRHVLFEQLQTVVSHQKLESGQAVTAGRKLGMAVDEALRSTIGAYVEEQTDDLLRLSRRDSLTGLLNHRSFYEELNREIKSARRASQPLAIALLDLDRFKRVNDVHGHREGDRVLRAWAQALLARLRKSDIVARYGGDEFAALLPGADKASATLALRTLARYGGSPDAASDESNSKPRIPLPGISWGVAEYPADGRTAEALVEAADHRLRSSKRTST